MTKVYVPLYAGLFSALGLLLADYRYDYVQSVRGELNSLGGRELLASFGHLVSKLEQDVSLEGLDRKSLATEKCLDLRYESQSSELTLNLPEKIADDQVITTLTELFHAEHERLYGYRRKGDAIAVVNFRLKAFAKAGSMSFAGLGHRFVRNADSTRGIETSRNAYFGVFGERSARVMNRAGLLRRPCAGPMIVEELDTTIVIPPGWRASLDELGNVVLETDQADS
jgi:N-methylhydantoinase A